MYKRSARLPSIHICICALAQGICQTKCLNEMHVYLCGQKIPISLRITVLIWADDIQTLVWYDIPTKHHDLICQCSILHTRSFPNTQHQKIPSKFLAEREQNFKGSNFPSVRVALNEWVVWNETHLWHKSDWSLNPGHACKELHWSERDGIGETWTLTPSKYFSENVLV